MVPFGAFVVGTEGKIERPRAVKTIPRPSRQISQKPGPVCERNWEYGFSKV